MKKTGIILIVLAIVAAIAVVVFVVVLKRKAAADDNADEDSGNAQPSLPSYTPTAPVASPTPAPSATSTNTSGVKYDANERSITVGSIKFTFPSRSEVKDMQNFLLQALGNANGSTGKSLLDAMNSAGGADGLIGNATANAFAYIYKNAQALIQTRFAKYATKI